MTVDNTYDALMGERARVLELEALLNTTLIELGRREVQVASYQKTEWSMDLARGQQVLDRAMLTKAKETLEETKAQVLKQLDKTSRIRQGIHQLKSDLYLSMDHLSSAALTHLINSRLTELLSPNPSTPKGE